MHKRLFAPLAGLSLLAVSSPVPGQEQPATGLLTAPGGADEETVGLTADRAARMTVPVSLSGQGPYRFIVDTGAERTVIARELAQALKLEAGTTARVHSMTEVSNISTVVIPKLEMGRKSVDGIHAPALARLHLGAEGMLGVDSLQSQRILFDFGKKEMTLTPADRFERSWPADTIVVTARSRFGHLVLVRASVEGEKVYAIVDTGSEITIGNDALRRRLAQKGKLAFLKPIELVSVTGGRASADLTRASRIMIGDIDINDLPIAFADVHPFRKLKLMDRPAILLGMDALRLFDKVSVDFGSKRVRLLPPDTGNRRGITIVPVTGSRIGGRRG
jgi:predicted aspartyl protease